jgi:hypothetical protein
VRQYSAHDGAGSRGYITLTGAMIGAGIGIVWLHSTVVESCLFALLGAFLAWTLAGEWRPANPMGDATEGDATLFETETMPLVPMLSWPAPFPVQVPVAPRQEQPARQLRGSSTPHCTAPRRRVTSGRTRRMITRGITRCTCG